MKVPVAESIQLLNSESGVFMHLHTLFSCVFINIAFIFFLNLKKKKKIETETSLQG